MFTQILHRPALAIVISIILLFLGVLGIKTLPIAQFPNIAPPTVQVSIAYPGASANVLVDAVLIPLEQSINGVQNMRYMVSSATSAGEATILIYFEPGTVPNINVVNVQNRVNIMLSRLPPRGDGGTASDRPPRRSSTPRLSVRSSSSGTRRRLVRAVSRMNSSIV